MQQYQPPPKFPYNSIGVLYGSTVESMGYAVALSERLPMPLAILIARGSPAWTNLPDAATTTKALLATFEASFRTAFLIDIGPGQYVSYDGTPADLRRALSEYAICLVSDRHAADTPLVPVFAPQGQTSLFLPEKRNILLPFGNGAASRDTIVQGLWWIAKQLHLPNGKVIFYHTTWPNSQVQSEEPLKHMHAEARAIWQLAIQTAEELRLPYEVVVETAKTVIQSIIEEALLHDVGLIVMKRSGNALSGDHCEAVLKLTRDAIPLLILPKTLPGESS